MERPSDTPMPLDKAVQVYFPHGGVTKSTLLAAIRRGTLAYEKIGRAYFVTDAGIMEWRRQCHVAANPHGSNTEQLKTAGSLSMDQRRSTQAAALATVRALKRSSESIARGMAASTRPNVTRLKSPSLT
jgi:hypothetical protein